MSIKLSDLTKETSKLSIDLGASEPLEIEYHTRAYTPELEESIVGAQERPAAALAQILQRLVVAWNLVDDNNQPYPLDEEHLGKLPVQVMISIFQNIAEDMRPNPPTAGN
jgi:hypothetical protein